MSEYLHVEQPFLTQLRTLGWEVIDQKCEVRSVKCEIAHESEDAAGVQPSNFKLYPSNFSVHRLLLKAQVDVNEPTGEADPVVRLGRGLHDRGNLSQSETGDRS